MNKIINGILKALYIIGILSMFSVLVVQFYDWFDGKDDDWYLLFLILVSFYSLCTMIYKTIKSRDFLERIKNIMNSKMEDSTKLSAIDFQMDDINTFLNNK